MCLGGEAHTQYDGVSDFLHRCDQIPDKISLRNPFGSDPEAAVHHVGKGMATGHEAAGLTLHVPSGSRGRKAQLSSASPLCAVGAPWSPPSVIPISSLKLSI